MMYDGAVVDKTNLEESGVNLRARDPVPRDAL